MGLNLIIKKLLNMHSRLAAAIVLGGVVFLLLWLWGRAASKERME